MQIGRFYRVEPADLVVNIYPFAVFLKIEILILEDLNVHIFFLGKIQNFLDDLVGDIAGVDHVEITVYHLCAAAANAGRFEPQRPIDFLDVCGYAPGRQHTVQPSCLRLFHDGEAVIGQLFF